MNNDHKLEGNIWKYGFLLVANKRIVAPILGAFYLTIPGVTAPTIGLIVLISSIASFILEVPSGYISDKLGHKQALVLSRVMLILSSLIFMLATNLTMLILGGILLSASMAFLSGTGSAFMHETLQALGREHEYTRIMGKLSAIGFSVPIALAAAVPFLVVYGYQLPFLISLIIDVICLFVTLRFVVPPVKAIQIDEIRTTNFRQVLSEGWKLNYFSIALFSGVLSGALFSLGTFRAPFQVWLEVPVIWFGILHGVGRILASLLLAYSEKIRQQLYFLRLLRFQIVIYSVLIIGLGILSNTYVLLGILILLNGFQWGLTKVEEGYQLQIIRHSKFKATLLSLESQINSLFAAIVAFGVGYGVGHFSYQITYLILGLTLLVVLIPLYLYIAKKTKTGQYNFSD